MRDTQQLLNRFREVRRRTEELCHNLETEDYVIQAMPEVSPPKWHLAHTTWFFEAFLLSEYLSDYKRVCPEYEFLFNSYYNTIGPQWHRPSRGHLSRPTVNQVMNYRALVNKSMELFIDGLHREKFAKLYSVIELGLNHEQQHQELLLTDIKYNFSINPLEPVLVREPKALSSGDPGPLNWFEVSGGRHHVGHQDRGSFCFDNERPRHEILIQDFRIANRLTTCAEFMEFIQDGGYGDPRLWLSDGWDWAHRRNLKSPLYWKKVDGSWNLMTLAGFKEISPFEPVCHISHFEADAFATWAGKRLLTEFEWEVAAKAFEPESEEGNFSEDGWFHPRPVIQPFNKRPAQMLGDVWEWTSSAYLPYPGFEPAAGAVGEYNGKFMSGQMVLRGGSTVTPRNHIRTSYRNFFQPDKRWQFSGIRLGDNA